MQTNGLVVASVDIGESDRLVTLLTPEHGKVTAKARGVRSAKSKLRFASNLCHLGDYILTETKGGYLITGADTLDSFTTLGTNPFAYYAAMVIVQCAEMASDEDVGDPTLYVEALRALKDVAYGNAEVAVIQWMWRLLSILGHGITLGCACGEEEAYINYQTAEMFCERHADMTFCHPIGEDEKRALHVLSAGLRLPSTMNKQPVFAFLGRLLWLTAGLRPSTVKALATQWNAFLATSPR